MYQITCQVEFDSAHRLFGYEGPCKHLHGHHYVAEVTVRGMELDRLGMVVDFGDLKGPVVSWINEHWDHNVLLHPHDILLEGSGKVFLGESPFVIPSGNPTAENMAKGLYEVVVGLLPSCVEMVRVRLYETPGCWVDYSE